MKKILQALLLLLALAAGSAGAAPASYDQATFDRLQHEGKPILVMVHADWCPTCKAQAPILAKLLAEPRYRSVTALRVDFDNQKPVVKAFRVTMQSTLIVFKGGKEVGRSTGDTRPAGIDALLKKAL